MPLTARWREGAPAFGPGKQCVERGTSIDLHSVSRYSTFGRICYAITGTEHVIDGGTVPVA